MKLESAPASLFRHPAWLAWKETQGWRQLDSGLGFRLLHRKIAGLGSMVYAAAPCALPGAYPKTADERGRALEDLSLRLSHALPPDCAFIRYDLMTSAWTDGEGRPLEARLQELRMNASTRWRRLRKAALERTCTDTMIVSLAGDEAALGARMDPRTRYSIRLAARRGTTVQRLDESGLERFYALHEETARRHRLPLQSVAVFRDLFQAAKRHGLGLDLYLADSRGRDAAAAVIARDGGSAWYLFAASAADRRDAAGPSAALHHAMLDCAREGVKEMDLLGVGPAGVSDHPLSGLTLFKSGFGGRRFARAGAWDFVLRPSEYADFAQAENLA